MARIELMPIGPEEFERFVSDVFADHARERAQAEMISLEAAKDLALKQRQQILVDGFDTKGHRFVRLLSKGSGLDVGAAWFRLNPELDHAFVFHLRVWPTYRRKGFGLAALTEIERQAKAAGCSHMTLNVFEPNAAGQGLYKKLGYRTISLTMNKAL